MPDFSTRRINQKTLAIIKKTGRIVACFQQVNQFSDESLNRVSDDPYGDDAAPLEREYKKYYIIALFEQQTEEAFESEGALSAVVGTLTVPRIYKDILSKTSYFDPYLNGSRFLKVGAALDDETILITQNVKSEYLPQSPGV